MRFLILIFTVLVAACSTKPKLPESKTLPTHPCLAAAAQNNLSYIEKNLNECRTVKSANGVTILMLAAAKGNAQLVNFLIQSGMDINEADLSFDTALSYASVYNQVDTVNLLILAGAELTTQDPSGVTPLMKAVQAGSPQMVYALSLTREAINARAADGWTALYFAIRRQDPQILGWLLRQGACKNLLDQEKVSPMDFAKEVGWAEGLAILEKAPACGKVRGRKL